MLKMKYRKKPKTPVFEAFQMTKERFENIFDWPEWMNKAWNENNPSKGAIWIRYDDFKGEQFVCGTLECPYRIDLDDWVIQDGKGKIYSCKPDIFEQTYEPVS